MREPKRSPKPTPKPDINLTVPEPAPLLEFLLKRLHKQPRSRVKSLLAHRAVAVDGVIVTQFDTPLKVGQQIKIRLTGGGDAPENMPKILYEDEDVLVINKPAGLLSIASGKGDDPTADLPTAYRMLTDYVKRDGLENRIFIVHRLDRDTSGVLLVAKSEEIKLALQDNWESLVKERVYMAVVEGCPKEKTGRIESWLKQTKTFLMYSSAKAGDGLKAITSYGVLKESEDYSLLRVKLETGRKNQIRVHMKDLGHSVVGDKKYGAKTNPLKRLGLHASRLTITHPLTGKEMRFTASEPRKFHALFSSAATRTKGKKR